MSMATARTTRSRPPAATSAGGPSRAVIAGAVILLVAVLGNAVPFALFYVALGRGGAAKVSAWFFLVPVVGVLTAWPLLGEAPGPRLWAGLVLVTAGLWMVLAPSRR